MSNKVNKTISIDARLNGIAKEMPNFSGFVQHCIVTYTEGNIEIDWEQINTQSKNGNDDGESKKKKTISIDKKLNEVTKEMPNFSGFVQHCIVDYTEGNIEIDWEELNTQSNEEKKRTQFGVNEFGYPNKMVYKGVGGSREERGRFAGFIPRTCALLIDLLLISVPGILLSLVGISSGVLFLIVGLVYPVLFNASSWQATPGKRLFGLVVTDYDGNRISKKKALKRHALIFLIIITFGFGYLAQLWTDHKQTNQDLIARTLVVKKGMDNWAQ
jgi:uncharacterized RDD family membrane protein YckC